MQQNSKRSGKDGERKVVKRIPIFLSNAQNRSTQENKSKLYLMQFPLAQASSPLNKANLIQKIRAQYKPNCDIVQMALPLDPRGVTYSRERGAEFGVGAAVMADQISSNTLKQKKEDDDEHSVEYLDHMIVEGSKVSNGSSGITGTYMLGYLVNDELHLSPLDSIMQFRPSFAHVDGVEMQEKANARGDQTEDSGSEIEDKAAVNVKKQALQVFTFYFILTLRFPSCG
jgi:DNA-directed RNA polymerase III subunit RPC5